MTDAMPCVVRGQQFPSLAAAAKHFGVHSSVPGTLLWKHGHLDGLGLGNSKRAKHRAKPVKFGRFSWPSRTEAARALGVAPSTMTRLARGQASRQTVEHIQERLLLLEQEAQRAGQRRKPKRAA